ncbi:MAG: mechanosensitive ion channel family protein [Acidobacteriota bacterium]
MPQSLKQLSQLLSDLASINPMSWLLSGFAFAAVVLAGLTLRRIFLSRMLAWGRGSSARLDGIFGDALRGPWTLWTAILGLYAATEVSDLPVRFTHVTDRLLLALWIISLTWVLARLSGGLVRIHGARADGTAGSGTLPQVLTSVVVGMLGALTLLNMFGIDVRPWLAALGVGGLAVALALQDTLSNFFAGFYVSVAGQIRVGDFVQLEGGPKGYVYDIGWRTTTLRELTNNLVIIPNNKLSQSIITNYHFPDSRTVLSIPVSAANENDAAQVENTLVDIVKKAAAEVPGILLTPPPRARLLGFGDSLQFTLAVQIESYEMQFDIQDELRKRILLRFRQDRIIIPAPVRAVAIQQPTPLATEAADKQADK